VREAVRLIVEKNLYGLDLDERAGQLAYFAVMMKARQYDRRFFSRDVQPNIGHFQGLSCRAEDFSDPALQSLAKAFENADEYGSLLEIHDIDIEAAANAVDAYTDDFLVGLDAREKLLRMVQLARMLSMKYDVVVTNPPYMGSSGMCNNLLSYVKEKYPNGKDDLFSCFIERTISWVKEYGFSGLMTSYTWMFLTGASNLRKYLLRNTAIQTLIQPEYHAFFQDANVPICAFVLRMEDIDYNGAYIRLNNFYGAEIQSEKALEAIQNPNCEWLYNITRDMFKKIPDMPIAYWIPEKTIDLFVTSPLMSSAADMKQGLITGSNDRFFRFWFECEKYSIANCQAENKRWFFYHKGGEYKKWYGNIFLVVNWENNGSEIINFRDEKGKQRSRPQNIQYYFREGFTWTALTVADFNVRYMPNNAIFDAKGSSGFPKNKDYLHYIMALCNSKVAMEFLSFLAPTMDYSAGSIGKIPFIFDFTKENEVKSIVKRCIDISRADWDSFETSWDFKKHPLIPKRSTSPQNSPLTTDHSPLKIEFALFCVDSLAEDLVRDPTEVYDLLTKESDIMHSYIFACYDSLHSQGKEYIVEDLKDVLRERGLLD
jgi:type II restriction/modification system DNA methylase subunit YeeA